jgi:hypothetical protein
MIRVHIREYDLFTSWDVWLPAIPRVGEEIITASGPTIVRKIVWLVSDQSVSVICRRDQ